MKKVFVIVMLALATNVFSSELSVRLNEIKASSRVVDSCSFVNEYGAVGKVLLVYEKVAVLIDNEVTRVTIYSIGPYRGISAKRFVETVLYTDNCFGAVIYKEPQDVAVR
jgi:hypothetical protein